MHKNPLYHITVYCLDSYTKSKCGTYAAFVRQHTQNYKEIKVTRSTAKRLNRIMKDRNYPKAVTIDVNIVAVVYTIIDL